MNDSRRPPIRNPNSAIRIQHSPLPPPHLKFPIFHPEPQQSPRSTHISPDFCIKKSTSRAIQKRIPANPKHTMISRRGAENAEEERFTTKARRAPRITNSFVAVLRVLCAFVVKLNFRAFRTSARNSRNNQRQTTESGLSTPKTPQSPTPADRPFPSNPKPSMILGSPKAFPERLGCRSARDCTSNFSGGARFAPWPAPLALVGLLPCSCHTQVFF